MTSSRPNARYLGLDSLVLIKRSPCYLAPPMSSSLQPSETGPIQFSTLRRVPTLLM